MAPLPEGRQPAAWGTGEEIANSERWQSGRMRVFAKDVSGQKLDRGFESRPLRWLVNVELNNALFSRLFEQGVIFGLHDFSENLLMPGRA